MCKYFENSEICCRFVVLKLKTMCKPLNEYESYLENLVREKSSVTFSNGGIEYAAVLMSILLKYTKHSVCMFCDGFKPELIKNEVYWKALNEYLKDKSKKLIVIVNTDAYIKEEPLQALYNAQQARGFDKSIMVYKIDEEGREMIKQQFNGSLNHFAIFDDDMYRLEYAPTDYKAFGSFNNTSHVKLLRSLFDSVIEHSTSIAWNS